MDRSEVVSEMNPRAVHQARRALAAMLLLIVIACTNERTGNPPAAQGESAAATG